MSKNKKTITGWLTRGKGDCNSEWVKFYPGPILTEYGYYIQGYTAMWGLEQFNTQYTCKGFKLKPGDCVLVEMEI